MCTHGWPVRLPVRPLTSPATKVNQGHAARPRTSRRPDSRSARMKPAPRTGEPARARGDGGDALLPLPSEPPSPAASASAAHAAGAAAGLPGALPRGAAGGLGLAARPLQPASVTPPLRAEPRRRSEGRQASSGRRGHPLPRLLLLRRPAPSCISGPHPVQRARRSHNATVICRISFTCVCWLLTLTAPLKPPTAQPPQLRTEYGNNETEQEGGHVPAARAERRGARRPRAPRIRSGRRGRSGTAPGRAPPRCGPQGPPGRGPAPAVPPRCLRMRRPMLPPSADKHARGEQSILPTLCLKQTSRQKNTPTPCCPQVRICWLFYARRPPTGRALERALVAAGGVVRKRVLRNARRLLLGEQQRSAVHSRQ